MAITNVDDIYAAIRGLPVPERLKLVERVVHDLSEAQEAVPGKPDARSVIGSLADVSDVMEQISEAAMAARERDPLRLSDG